VNGMKARIHADDYAKAQGFRREPSSRRRVGIGA